MSLNTMICWNYIQRRYFKATVPKKFIDFQWKLIYGQHIRKLIHFSLLYSKHAYAFNVGYKLHIYLQYIFYSLHAQQTHIMYARGGIKATPIPQKCSPPHSSIPVSVFAVVHHVINIQLKYTIEGVSKIPVPQEQAYFPRRSRGK